MSGPQETWLRGPGSRPPPQVPAAVSMAEEFPYLPESRADAPRRPGRHRRAGRLSVVTAAIRQAARKKE